MQSFQPALILCTQCNDKNSYIEVWNYNINIIFKLLLHNVSCVIWILNRLLPWLHPIFIHFTFHDVKLKPLFHTHTHTHSRIHMAHFGSYAFYMHSSLYMCLFSFFFLFSLFLFSFYCCFNLCLWYSSRCYCCCYCFCSAKILAILHNYYVE